MTKEEAAELILIFLSTPSARRATLRDKDTGKEYRYFYPRPPRGGRRKVAPPHDSEGNHFYPRPPRGGRPLAFFRVLCYIEISIHALREEGDIAFQLAAANLDNFYPRPPRGGRRNDLSSKIFSSLFLSTPSARRATNCRDRSKYNTRHFYPRPPRGGRPSCPGLRRTSSTFLSTPSARRATFNFHSSAALPVFLSTPSARRATQRLAVVKFRIVNFYPRPPRGGRPGSGQPR